MTIVFLNSLTCHVISGFRSPSQRINRPQHTIHPLYDVHANTIAPLGHAWWATQLESTLCNRVGPPPVRPCRNAARRAEGVV